VITRNYVDRERSVPQYQWFGGPSHRDRNELAAVMVFKSSTIIDYSATAVDVALAAAKIVNSSGGVL
jgi:hypothetical protein